MPAEILQKPVLLLVTNDQQIMGVFKSLGRHLMGNGCDLVLATVRKECQKNMPDILTAVDSIKKGGREVAGIMLHDKTLPLDFKDDPGFQLLWNTAVEDLEQTRRQMKEGWREKLDSLTLQLPEGMDPTQQSVLLTQFDALKEEAAKIKLDEAMAGLQSAKDAANGLLERLVPSDASLDMLKTLRQEKGLGATPIVIIGSYPGREREYEAAAGGDNTHVFASNFNGNFFKAGANKLKELVPLAPSGSQDRPR